MKTIELGAALPSLGEVLELASQENVVLRTSEGREFVLAELDDFEHELDLVRKNDALLDLLRQRAAEKPRHSLAEARKLLEANGNDR